MCGSNLSKISFFISGKPKSANGELERLIPLFGGKILKTMRDANYLIACEGASEGLLRAKGEDLKGVVEEKVGENIQLKQNKF